MLGFDWKKGLSRFVGASLAVVVVLVFLRDSVERSCAGILAWHYFGGSLPMLFFSRGAASSIFTFFAGDAFSFFFLFFDVFVGG